MSRIYEAMKKLEKERASNGSAGVAKPSHAGITEEVPGNGAARQVSGIVSGLRTVGANTTVGYLRLNELRQRCAKPGWSARTS